MWCRFFLSYDRPAYNQLFALSLPLPIRESVYILSPPFLLKCSVAPRARIGCVQMVSD